ncbi:unnamed protein product [Clonostachys rosea]|uniref:F-box domain-containing protein n=1 Tax=Bionectria ochroleuca TaxID=29856 RepID=A0ABY6TX48_BIOOC|nr:unnamed protein product [Clonostachys rosea]
MAPFSDAPTEVIDQILGYVPRSDLPNVCLVNKSLQSSAESFLYSTVSFEWTSSEMPPIASFVASLVRRPELADQIDVVALKGHLLPRTAVPAMDTSTIPLDQLAAAIEKTKVPFTSMWIEKLRSADTCIYALAALLIANLSKTTHLTIQTPYINGQPLIAKVLQAKNSKSGQLPAFERLKQLRYVKHRDISNPDNNMIFDDTINLFYLPTVTDLEITMTNPETFRWPAGEPNLDHLTSLRIGWLQEDFLAKIFPLTRNLKSLSWRWEHHGPPHPWETTTLDFDKISDVLELLKGTLESLEFELWLGEDDELADSLEMDVQGNLRRLRDFPHLTHLNVPLTSREDDNQPLDLADYAPDSVEVLTLPGTALTSDWRPSGWDVDGLPYEEIIPLIQSLADARPVKLPRLKRVIIIDDYGKNIRRKISERVSKLDLGFEVIFN